MTDVSFMESYRWWYSASRISSNGAETTTQKVSKLFGRHSYKFPDNYNNFLKAGGWDVCPLCDGWGDFDISSKKLLCACICVSMTHAMRQRQIEQGIVVPGVSIEDVYKFDGDYIKEAAAYVKSWLGRMKPWLAFLGPTGTGKSSMMRGMFWEHPNISAYITAKGLEQILWNSVASSDGAGGRLVEYLSRVPILYLDDLGQELGKDFVKGSLWYILDQRDQYRNDRVTVFSSNLNRANLWAWSNSIAGRILQEDLTEVILFQDNDYRRGK